MAAKHKPSPFSVRSEQYATQLRTATFETGRTVRRDATHACFTSFESDWHRFLCQATRSRIVH